MRVLSEIIGAAFIAIGCGIGAAYVLETFARGIVLRKQKEKAPDNPEDKITDGK